MQEHSGSMTCWKTRLDKLHPLLKLLRYNVAKMCHVFVKMRPIANQTANINQLAPEEQQSITDDYMKNIMQELSFLTYQLTMALHVETS